MHIIPVFLALIGERFADLEHSWRQPANLVANSDWLKSRLVARGGWWNGYLGVVIMLFVPAFVTSLIDDALQGLFFGLLELGFGTVVLLYCMGPVNQGALVRKLDEALITGDEASARRYTRTLLNAEPPVHIESWPTAVARSLFAQSAERIFSVVFWFVLIGPVGAVVYRVAALLKQNRDHEDVESAKRDNFHYAVRHVHQILAWLPVRLLAATFALAGRFNETLEGWQIHDHRCVDDTDGSGKGLLVCTGSAAAGIPSDDESMVFDDEQHRITGVAVMLDALGLLERTQVIWLLLLGFLYLAGYAA